MNWTLLAVDDYAPRRLERAVALRRTLVSRGRTNVAAPVARRGPGRSGVPGSNLARRDLPRAVTFRGAKGICPLPSGASLELAFDV